ncbi:MAG TPA: hypothetical protein V6C76_11915 [Drouetiella sp.]
MQSLVRRCDENFKSMFGHLGQKFALSADGAKSERRTELNSAFRPWLAETGSALQKKEELSDD